LTSVGGVVLIGRLQLATNRDPAEAHWSVLELTYPRAQRFGKQEEAHPRERFSLPPVARRNAAETGTDVLDYISEIPAVSVFTLQDGAVYHTYATNWRGVEFLMGFYPILDRVPKGRDEGDAFQVWIHRHDEYEDARAGKA
jgi:predicted dithiol-disulfide oxidoreductase (DUF899 family)